MSTCQIKHCAIQTHFSKKNFSENKRWRWIQGFLCSFEDRKTHSEIEARNYYDTVNKTKYNEDRKRELSSLLGTGLRKTRADSSGTTSSRTTNTSVNTNVTNVSADVTPNINSDTEIAAVQINGRTTQGNGTGERFAKQKVLPRPDTRGDYFAMYNFPKNKGLTSVDRSKEYLSMNPVRKESKKRDGEPLNNFQIIPEVLEFHEAIIH